MSTSTRILIVLAVTALVLVCSQNKGATEGRRGSAPVPFVVDDSNLSMSSVADVPTKRRQIIQFLWGPGGFPTQQTSSVRPNVANPLGIPISNIARIDQLNFVLGEGIRNAAFHFVPANSNGKLVIVHQG